MKKLLLLISSLVITQLAVAQTVPNAGFETWHTSTTGDASPVTIDVPDSWFGADSLIISYGQLYGSIISIPPSAWHRQLFKESTIIHGGSYSAKLVTEKQDTLGVFPGIMSNAQANVSIGFSGSGFTVSPITYTGGTPTTYMINTVSAWVNYQPADPLDSATIGVNVYSTVSGMDSLIGTGFVTIGQSSSTTAFTQYTANVTYNGSGLPADTVRILFSSSAGTHNTTGSTMYVDDVTMTGTPNAVAALENTTNKVSVYPNPASNMLYLDGKPGTSFGCSIVSVSGQVVAGGSYTGKGIMDISSLSEGIYLYTITDARGNVSQSGKVSVIK